MIKIKNTQVMPPTHIETELEIIKDRLPFKKSQNTGMFSKPKK